MPDFFKKHRNATFLEINFFQETHPLSVSFGFTFLISFTVGVDLEKNIEVINNETVESLLLLALDEKRLVPPQGDQTIDVGFEVARSDSTGTVHEQSHVGCFEETEQRTEILKGRGERALSVPRVQNRELGLTALSLLINSP